jgi:hypothetical protein
MVGLTHRGGGHGRRVVGGVTGVVLAACTFAACSKGPVPHPPTTTTSSSTTTTVPPLPSAMQVNPDAAASDLVSFWSTSNRAAALTVAVPAAVTTLFAAAYHPGLAISRGCSTAFDPIVCTYGPPGGAPPTDPIYEIRVSQALGGKWYVSSVQINN